MSSWRIQGAALAFSAPDGGCNEISQVLVPTISDATLANRSTATLLRLP